MVLTHLVLFKFFSGAGQTAAGSVVTRFNGVSNAGGVTSYRGVSLPNILLTDAGGGSYTVNKTHRVHRMKPSGVDEETYIIDGILP